MTPHGPPRPLEVWPCQSVCRWAGTGEVWQPPTAGGVPLRVFACSGCGSEWVRSEVWTPVNAHGDVPPAVEQERARITATDDEDAAGTADS